jgi:Ca2+-binding RTX toxin-like protein
MAAITGIADNDTLKGTADPDVIGGLVGDDVLFGLGGNDAIIADSGAGVTAAVLVANFGSGLAMTASEFLVVGGGSFGPPI